MSETQLNFSGDAAEPSRLPRQLRIVIADDERDTVLTLMHLLRDEGYEVRSASNGLDAVRVVRDFDADAALIDIGMPGISGWEVARQIRGERTADRPLLIAVSGVYKQGADKVLAEMAGFNYYLAKPYDPNVLLALLKPLATPSER